MIPLNARHRTIASLAAAALVVAMPASAAARPDASHGHAHQPPAHQLHLPDARTTTQLGTTTGADATAAGAPLVARNVDPSSGQLWVYPSNGSTSGNPWTLDRYLAADQFAFADVLLVGDVTGDGHPDLVARDPNAGNGTLWVYPGNGSTTSNPWTTRFSAGTDWNVANALLLADTTGDGHADLIARDSQVDNGTLWIYPNNGSTTGDPWTLPRIWAGTGWDIMTSVMVGDVYNNGHPAMVGRDDSGALWVYPNNGSTSSDPWTSRTFAGSGWNVANLMTVGDVTGDGYPDVVMRDYSGALWVYPNNGAGSGNPWTVSRFSAGTDWGFARDLVVADLAGDGDAALLARPGGDLWVYPNSGASSGNPWTLPRVAAGNTWSYADRLITADLSGTGAPYLVARNSNLDNGTLWIYPPSGSTWSTTPYFAGNGWNLATAMMIGDVNGDGLPDMLIRDRNGDLWLYPGNGSATGNPWTSPRSWAGTGWNTARALALADVNGDGIDDLVDLEQDGTLWIYSSDPSVAPVQVTGDFSDVTALTVGDVYGTGQPDLVLRDNDGSLWIYPDNGSTTGNPWTSRTAAGTGWQYADSITVPSGA